LPGEARASWQRLIPEDRGQSKEGLVALMRNGKVLYKRVEELSEEGIPVRVAANRWRTTRLKERLDGWLNRA
jgi:hypothetical protein